MSSFKLAIAATFTAEPLRDSLAFWNDKLQWQAEIAFAAYNQVFQELLGPASLLSTNRMGANLVLVRPEDWCKDKLRGGETGSGIRRGAHEFVQAIQAAVERATVPYLICLCPASPGKQAAAQVVEAEKLIGEQLENCSGVHLLRPDDVMSLYPVGAYYDAAGEEIGHIPYTTEFFAALGTAVARRIYSLRQNPYKVIVTDCDDTLWKGVCGEVGPHAVEIDPGRRALQEFLLQQQGAGMLLCLCSKNAEEDVDEVFRCHTAMPLRREHIIARRINWQPKPQNLRELAAELQLGLDAFIFIDDNPLECEQVKLACPEVLSLQLPSSENIPRFLQHVWAFDKCQITEEDRRRTALYREDQQRDLFRQQAPTLESFLAGLRLRIDIAAPTPEQLPRVAQLTQRTNQFNCTALRRSEEQIRQSLDAGQMECLAVRVSDRFGDYGLTGATIFRARGDALEVDTFLLSCRVLGRGVEHAMLRKLGEVAVGRGLSRVNLKFLPSKKNTPALAFLESVAADFKEPAETGYVFRVPAGCAISLSEKKVLATSQAAATAVWDQETRNSENPMPAARSELMQEVASELADVDSILKRIRTYKGFSSLQGQASGTQPQTSYEAEVLNAWNEVLGISAIRPNDDFFALGGDSLLATQVVSRLRQVCGVGLHLGDLFDNPTVAGLATLIEKAQGKLRHAATDKEHVEDDPAALSRDRIPRRTTLDPCALSFSQQRWWFLNQWAPDAADHLSLVLRLKGALDGKALERSLQCLVERHEILRTTYRLLDGSPVQVLAPAAAVPLSRLDLTGIPESQRDQRAEEIFEAQFRRTFDLSQDQILRASLLEFADDDHALVLVMHHIATDGWSRGILLRELEAAYRAYTRGQEPDYPELPVQYADFSLWQRRQVDSGYMHEQLSYWKQRLSGASPVLQLPADRSRPAAPDLREGVLTLRLPIELLQQLHAVGKCEGATLFMTLLAAFQALLYRYTGQQDIVVGSPVAGRDRPDLEGLVGCFINMVAFRAHIGDQIGFRKFLAQIRQVTLEGQERQDVPFERLVEEIEQGRDMSRAPIFQVVFALENLLSVPDLPGLEVQLREVETRSAFHDLSLFAAEEAHGLRLRFEYRADLFDATTIERMANHFANLLAAIVADPGQSIGSLPMLSDGEHKEILFRWNDRQEYPVHVCIQELFQKQARRVPGHTAVGFEGQTMTYAELNARSNQLARYLIRMGVGPEVLVGLCCERSLDLVIAILATLKAGGAYLPLDPRYPKDRLAFMLQDAQPPVVIAQYEWKEVLPDINGQVLAIDADWGEIERESTEDFACSARTHNLAYVIYTSGSTGRPKGCQITHANVVRLLAATEDWFHFDEHDVWTMFHSYAFDFSVWEIFGALAYGGKLVVVPHVVSRSPEDFYRLLQTEGVTVLNQTPSSFRQLMEVDERTGSGELALRYVIFGGEALEMQSLRPWFERHGDQTPRLINMYGITETTVHVTYRPLSLGDTKSGSVIGRPIPDLQVYLLDRNLQPVPIGVPGEMYIGGAGVARGYLNRPELNTERFVADIFRPGQSRRLYRSGDQARRLANGDIEYLGRIDQQVKIRGFRVELGEIESVLAQHPGVREALVILHVDECGEKRLVAYVVPQNGHNPLPAELHAFLKDHVPDYMIPAVFVPIDDIPLTSNGKIDRAALPAADFSGFENQGGWIEPRTPLEQEVADAWKEVLGLERMSVNDNFFAIGGHSLLATRVVIRLRTKLGLNFSLRLLFENPTVAGMAAALIDPLIEHADEQEVVTILNELEGMSDHAARQMRASGIESVAASITSGSQSSASGE